MRFADADRADEDDVLLARQELQGEDLLELAAIELDRRGPIEAVQRDAVLEASLQQVAFEGLVVAALDLVGQQQRQERRVIELLGARQRQPLGQAWAPAGPASAV